MRDRVSPETALEVFTRDDGCMAPRLGGSFMECWGRNRIEHIKPAPRAGKRAKPRKEELLTLCEGHTEPGMKAGYVWCTDKANREECRAHLRKLYPDYYAVLDAAA